MMETQEGRKATRSTLLEATLLQWGAERYFDAGEGAKAV